MRDAQGRFSRHLHESHKSRSAFVSHRKAIYCQALAAVLLSTGGLLIKVVAVEPLLLLGVRGAVAALVIGLYMGRPLFGSRPPLSSILRKPGGGHFRWSVPQLGGAIALVAAQLLFIIAVRETTAANAIFLQYTAPVFVAFFGIRYLREPVKKLDWFALAAIGVGMLFFYGDGLTADGATGNLYALLAGLAFAWFLLFMRKQKDTSTIETVFLGNVLAALVGLPFLRETAPSAADWSGMLVLGIFQIGLPFILIALAIKKLTAVEAVLIQALEPIFNPIWVFLIIGETPTPLALLGGVIVLGAVTLRSILATRMQRMRPASQPIS